MGACQFQRRHFAALVQQLFELGSNLPPGAVLQRLSDSLSVGHPCSCFFGHGYRAPEAPPRQTARACLRAS